MLTPSQRVLRARAAAHAMHAQGKTDTEPARRAFLSRFEREVDPEGALPPAERARRAEHARKAYMAALALKSARARASKKAAARVGRADGAGHAPDATIAPTHPTTPGAGSSWESSQVNGGETR